MKNELNTKEKASKQEENRRRVEYKIQRWKRMEEGDVKALFEIMVELGMAKEGELKEDFEE